MRYEQRRRVVLICTLITLAWLAGGTFWFAHWQASEGAAASATTWWNAIEAALLVALVFWVLAGIAYGVIIWIVTGRGPQA